MTKQEHARQAFIQTVYFLRQLVQEGLKHVVISPGSRSTPLTLGASTFEQLNKHVILDERSAAFTALGIGKGTAIPAALICTSGTAVANYYPAVIEARKSGVPMLLLTADRPAQLHGTGANQTIDQQHIFGGYPIWFKDMAEQLLPGVSSKQIKDSATNSFNKSTHHSGPVHLNFPYSKPLEPSHALLKSIITDNKKLEISPHQSIDEPTNQSFDADVQSIIETSKQPLVIIGQLRPDTDIQAISNLAEQLNAPVLAETDFFDTNRSIHGFEGFLRNDTNQHHLEPDCILRFGHQPASKSLLMAIQNWHPANHIYFQEGELKSTIKNSVTNFIEWNGQSFDTIEVNKNNNEWFNSWKKAEKHFYSEKISVLKKQQVLTDGHIYHHLCLQIPDDWFVFIGNSFAARDQSLFGRWNNQKRLTNRGVSGIDGINSTALGVNLGLDQPGILFTGDLSFLHDTNALLNKNKLTQPLVVVAINNQGGSLFRMLPIVDYPEQFTPYFETPQETNITKLAQSYGITTHTVHSVNALEKLQLNTLVEQPSTKLQIVECKTDPDISMKIRKYLWDFEL